MEYNKTELKKYNYLIGQKIKAIRDLKGFKQDYVAEKLGISSGHYSMKMGIKPVLFIF